ncbi:MAG: 2-phospho-L-lactate transferase CofD family protein, partial [Ktedonobacterales bacterium]
MILALAGGVGGAKLAAGLYASLAPDQLAIVVNTGDDFDLYGLRISPDADTVLYTLAGLANAETGWGVAGDT